MSSGFVVQITTTNARDDRKRVDAILAQIRTELAAGRSSGGIRLEGEHIGTWGFTR